MRLRSIERDGSVDLGGADGCNVLAGVIEMTVALYERRGFIRPWIGYVAVDSGQAIGTCGFAGPPSDDEAEIAYFTFPGREGRGVATTMAAALLGLSADAARSRGASLIAHTLPTEGPSTTILRKLGFSLLGAIHHPEDGAVWKWRVTGYVIRGSWRYLEHHWVATEGSFVYEPPGEIHTLVVDEAAGGARQPGALGQFAVAEQVRAGPEGPQDLHAAPITSSQPAA